LWEIWRGLHARAARERRGGVPDPHAGRRHAPIFFLGHLPTEVKELAGARTGTQNASMHLKNLRYCAKLACSPCSVGFCFGTSHG